MIITQIFLWSRRAKPKPQKRYRVVKAGAVSQTSPLMVQMTDLFSRKYVVNGERVDPNEYDVFVVDGQSMSKDGINSGDVLFVQRLYGADRWSIQRDKYIILIFECNEAVDCVVKFKLRKTVGYITEEDVENIDSWIEKNSIENPTLFKEKFAPSLQKYKEKNPNDKIDIICSITYNQDSLCYSFHPVKMVESLVKYVLPKESI